MSKTITLNKSQEKMKVGIDEAVNTIKITIGPRGKNLCLSNGEIVNDGKRIVEDIILKDPIQNKGAMKVRNLVRKISLDVGGGRTACAILYQEIISKGLNLLQKGYNFNALREGMDSAVSDIVGKLDEMARPAKAKELEQVATISTERKDLGKVIADTIKKIGKDGVVTVEESNTIGITSEIAEGLKFDRGWISPYMVTNPERMEAEYKSVPVFLTDKKISSFREMIPVLDKVAKSGRKDLVIIADDVDGEALNMFILNKLKGVFNVLAIKNPGVGDLKKYTLEDLSQLTGASIASDHTKDPKLGVIDKIISKEKSTIIIGGGGDLKSWITTLGIRKELCENKWEIDQYVERIAKLSNGIAVIKVGASSDDEIKYLKLKIEDGVNETKRALEEGVIAGGNVSFLYAQKQLKHREGKDESSLGYNLVLQSLEAPLRQIIENGGYEPSLVVHQIKQSENLTIGYNSLDNRTEEDIYSLGVIDAVKVVKTVLKNAVSEAIMFLSLGGDISEELKEDE